MTRITSLFLITDAGLSLSLIVNIVAYNNQTIHYSVLTTVCSSKDAILLQHTFLVVTQERNLHVRDRVKLRLRHGGQLIHCKGLQDECSKNNRNDLYKLTYNCCTDVESST